MKSFTLALAATALTAVSWGVYGPIMNAGVRDMGGSHLLPFIAVGIAYFLIAVLAAGAVLATRGRWDQQVPACVQCHGPAGVGVGAHFPPLAGQPAAYIEAQLKAWQQGTRHNDSLQLMQHLSSALSAQDVHDVAAWFAAQPLTAQGATP